MEVWVIFSKRDETSLIVINECMAEIWVMLSERIKGRFVLWNHLKKEPRELSPLVLAYIGDAVYELYVRLSLVCKGNLKVNQLHRESISLVNAGAQAHFLHQLENMLTDEEKQ